MVSQNKIKKMSYLEASSWKVLSERNPNRPHTLQKKKKSPGYVSKYKKASVCML